MQELSKTSISETHFDIVIIGGGLVGATTALCLARSCPNLSIAVVEAIPATDQSQPSFDDRSIAIAQQSAQYLATFNLFNENVEYCEAIKTVHVSDKGHFGKTKITAQEYQLDALGYVVEVKPFGHSLHNELIKTKNISLLCPDSVVKHNFTLETAYIALKSGLELSCALVIVADGGQSVSRDLLHIDFKKQSYEQDAIIANIEVSSGHNNQAFERFTQYGPMALLPMNQNRYSLVWCQNPEKAKALRALPEKEFISQLQAAFGFSAGKFTQVGMRACYPLALGKAERIVQHRVAVIGNAAHLVHPIAGQGFNLGLRDIQALVSEVKLALQQNKDIGCFEALRNFELKRKKDLDTVLTLTDSLVRLFSNSSRMLALARSIGLVSLDLFSDLKQPLAKQFMGKVKPEFIKEKIQ
ncbi:2-octaprenyl-6-methoxyphenyl hydroxylase [Pseudoalteromonas denitrificans]|uniref:2-octaprenyl-6-methoxyphenol hydroxylase n=1 Tax=Pseudoalteromonas denitrificans DSM 6059 TaxID=1123010 RepID=A0A1I1UPB9_9GAMM|nr:2-octaprenyl-6-methoxyphenyl hydroxylase [Pseudoalteromonas denitrificans]SFD71478.1 2-octaprenyl-6-methoxyphenol hydroxylase [Pseudoalteromonas denitrificans DSM 6059]